MLAKLQPTSHLGEYRVVCRQSATSGRDSAGAAAAATAPAASAVTGPRGDDQQRAAPPADLRLPLAERALAEKNTEAVLLLSRVALLEAELSSALANAAVAQR